MTLPSVGPSTQSDSPSKTQSQDAGPSARKNVWEEHLQTQREQRIEFFVRSLEAFLRATDAEEVLAAAKEEITRLKRRMVELRETVRKAEKTTKEGLKRYRLFARYSEIKSPKVLDQFQQLATELLADASALKKSEGRQKDFEEEFKNRFRRGKGTVHPVQIVEVLPGDGSGQFMRAAELAEKLHVKVQLLQGRFRWLKAEGLIRTNGKGGRWCGYQRTAKGNQSLVTATGMARLQISDTTSQSG